MNATLYSEKNMNAAESKSAIADQNWRLLSFFNLYRVAIALLAAVVALSPVEIPPFGEEEPGLFTLVSLIYLSVALLGFGAVRAHLSTFENQATFLAFIDITAITLLMHASGGLGSGFGLMLLVSIAASSLMLSKRLTVFFASLATIAIGIEQNWTVLNGGPWVVDHYPQMGMFGIGLFATAFFTYELANRLRKTEALAVRRGVDLANLTQINGLIIHHMQSGVLVCDVNGRVLMINQPAAKFLAVAVDTRKRPPISDFSPDLGTQLFRWLEHRDNRVRQLLRTRAGYTLLPRFVVIGSEQDGGVLVFLEDTSILRQQAQQLKMAALARLTASIAHEIRNPLGAISNAAQLLSETAPESAQEQRLIRIIEDQSQRMNVIVENVMQLGRRDHVNPVKFDLHRWVSDCALQFCESSRLPADAVAVVGEKDVLLYADSDQLYQVVTNLCQNALKHSPPFKDRALIELEVGHDHEGRPFLDVIDWGTGIAPEIADNIFDPFFTTTPKGTGLGLYIARELCEGNGARLDYHPGEGAGCRFRITFPKADD